MERRGGLCIARYAAEPDVAWKVGRIMLRYRPIAPKPAAAGSAAPTLPATADNGSKSKRKGSGCKGEGRRGRKSRKTMAAAATAAAAAAAEEIKKKPDSPVSPFSPPLSSSSPSCSSNSSMSSSPPPTITSTPVVTLPLMPETPQRLDENKQTAGVLQQSVPHQLDVSLPCLQQLWRVAQPEQRPSVVVAPRPMRPAGSWVTLECVEETWRDGELPSAGDEEIMKSMEAEDACPIFISDRTDRVVVVNEAYKKMVMGGQQENLNGVGAYEEVRVALVTRGMVPAGAQAFTCRVRVRYASRRGRGSLAAPCDVWRIGDGRLAWKLDTKAALSLSMGQ